jgi:DMSO reductase anchor subunit
MSNAVVAAVTFFLGIFLGLRLIEYVYHRIKKTPDWSPHWGSWAFAVLAGVYGFIANIGR